MIDHDMPLTREKWMKLAYLDGPPKHWTAENEMEVPAPWRHERHIKED